ncbi:MAG: hypothetical protein ACMXYL_02605 [Candidatus Woesearchaeota archaeon]
MFSTTGFVGGIEETEFFPIRLILNLMTYYSIAYLSILIISFRKL